jgi:hypothetical protein
LSVSSESPTAVLVKIDILKNGVVWKTLSPLSPTFGDTITDAAVTEDGYYRVEVTSLDLATGRYYFAFSNPVFIRPR